MTKSEQLEEQARLDERSEERLDWGPCPTCGSNICFHCGVCHECEIEKLEAS